ncbi:hypothetical protein V500_10419 [Pseudogymnoascus sp. VKM F-4518 (FW-2643)]|nr:hypothetical protein V500_10419 [Pseudogymnoascus sp. VKM F-4518 (FW-2643)]
MHRVQVLSLRIPQGYEKALGAEHTSTLKTVNNLGLLYAYQGKLVEAEQMHQRALQGKERAWGPEHTLTLDTVNNLGVLYKNQGKLVEAEQMYQQALQGYEKAWGPEHTSTLNTVNNLGLLYADQGKLVEAEQMYQRALQGMEKAWGLEHTSTLDTVNNLGNLYRNQGKLVEAEQMHQRALQGKEKAWGPEHTSTLKTVNNLGLLYKDQGKLAKAEQMYLRALRGYENALYPEHTLTLTTVEDLGHVLQMRCYAAVKHSTRIIVHLNVKQLVSLCLKFPRSRQRLLIYLVRAFAWIGDSENSIAAFEYQLAVSSSEYNFSCDGCDTKLGVDTSRFVCTVCEDRDLCKSCFDKLEGNEFEDSFLCQGHTFLELDGTSMARSSSKEVETSCSIEQWLKDIAEQ